MADNDESEDGICLSYLFNRSINHLFLSSRNIENTWLKI